jgi:hypothetical protein
MTTNTIKFFSGQPSIEVLRLSKDGIWANPDISVDETANLVLKTLDVAIKGLVQKALEEEREACEALHDHEDVQAPVGNSSWGEAYQEGWGQGTAAYRDAIRARGQA